MAEEEAVEAAPVEDKSRRDKKLEAHEQKVRERTREQELIKHEFAKLKDNPVILDIQKKAKSLADYHTKVAKDGVGFKKNTVATEHGLKEEQEVVYLTHEKRVTELDKAAGLEELLAYLDRMLTVE